MHRIGQEASKSSRWRVLKKTLPWRPFHIVFFLPYSSLALIVIVMDGGGCAWQPFTCFYTWIWLMTCCCVYIFTVCWRSMAYKKDGEEEVCYTVTITLPPCPKTKQNKWQRYSEHNIHGGNFHFLILIYIPWACVKLDIPSNACSTSHRRKNFDLCLNLWIY